MDMFNHNKNVFKKAYIYRSGAGDFTTFHAHTCWELCYYEDGLGKTNIGQNVFYHNPKDVILIEPNLLHNDICLENYTVYCFQFDHDLNIPSMQINNTAENADIIREIVAQLQITIALNKDPSLGDAEKAEKLNEQTYYIVYLITKLVNSSTKTEDYYRQLINYLQSYLYSHNTINYVELSEKTSYSIDRLRKIFKQQVGMPIYKYHTELILMKIKILLTTTNLPMNQIAVRCGFSSQSMLSQFFSAKSGISPLHYRNLYTDRPRDGVFKANKA